MPKTTIELLPKTYNYTIGISNAKNQVVVKNTNIKGNISS
jgi:hypothetical protein